MNFLSRQGYFWHLFQAHDGEVAPPPFNPVGSELPAQMAAHKGSGIWKWCVGAVLVGMGFSSQAQWQTQTNVIKSGWTAVYLHVDASSQSLDQLVGSDPANPISEIWFWKASSSAAQYVTTPQSPLNGGGQWITWLRSATGTHSTLGSLAPNTAYLIHSASNYTWRVKGKPAPPSYLWDISGLNFIGFPTPAANAPRFQDYLAPASALTSIAEIYQYTGGDLGANNNPGPVLSRYATRVTRGQAFWIRATNVNNTYFGPFKVILPNTTGIDFGDAAGQFNVQIQNATTNSLTVTAKLLASETPPINQTAIVGVPPLLVRGALNSSNLTYSCPALGVGGSQSWKLAPQGQAGSSIVVTLGVNRYALVSHPGSLYAGILQFTDSLGFSEVNVPVTATSATTAGLWVGSASVTQVGNYLKSYAMTTVLATTNLLVGTNTDGTFVFTNRPIYGADGKQLIVTNQAVYPDGSPNAGAYIVTGINTNLGGTPTPYPLRLIVHNDGTKSYLLQRVYYGLRQDTNIVVATTESVLDPSHLDTARRITATQLPWLANTPGWPFSGSLALGGNLSTTVTTSFDDQAASPFLHTYHPDHNNLDPLFKTQLSKGGESYDIVRKISLNFSAPGNDFASLTTANRSLSGIYQETITLDGGTVNNVPASRTFNVTGVFSLNRISPISQLTTH
jgi:hypothetical protein